MRMCYGNQCGVELKHLIWKHNKTENIWGFFYATGFLDKFRQSENKNITEIGWIHSKTMVTMEHNGFV